MNEENLEQGIKETKEEVSKLGRREAIKVGAAVAGGLALGLGTYVKPGVVSVGVQESYAATGGAGCTPGFWGGSPTNRDTPGYNMWNEPSDPDWSDPPGGLEWPYSGLPAGPQPFYASQPFDTYFPGVAAFSSFRLDDFVPQPPPPPGATRAEMAGRACVAGSLNAAWFGTNFPYTVGQIATMWANAVAASTSGGVVDQNSTAFDDLANLLGGYNEGICAS